MIETTHQKFQTLLQVAADQTLRPEEQIILDRHLVECNECRTYAQSLTHLQDGLRRVMQQQWNIRSQPLSADLIRSRAKRTILPRPFAAFGKFAFIPMLALTIFMVMTIRMTNPQKTSPALDMTLSGTPSMALLIPKPPASITVAKAHTQTCKQVTYTAQANETLSGVAIKYGVSKESIAAYNGLSADKLDAPLTLVIPICERSPLETTTTTTTTPTAPNTMNAPFDGPVNPSPRG
jgi:hypothetical protein